MRSDTQRIDKYTAKVTPTTVGLKIAALLPLMPDAYTIIQNDLQPIESQIATVMSATSVPAAQWGAFYAYGRELWKRKKLGGDPALTADAQLIKDKWAGRVTLAAPLITIASTVFGITVT